MWFLFLSTQFGPWLLFPSSDALLNHEVPGKIPLVCRKDWKTTPASDSQRTPQSTSTSKRNTEQLRTVFGSSRIVTLSCSRTVFDRSDNGLCILYCLENPALQTLLALELSNQSGTMRRGSNVVRVHYISLIIFTTSFEKKRVLRLAEVI